MSGRRRRSRQRFEPPRWATVWSRPRVLVEHVEPDVRDALVRGLVEHGYDVIGCPGPRDGIDRPDAWREGRNCPLLEDLPCPAVNDADAIATGLAHTPTGRDIIRRIHRQVPDRPLIIEGTPWMVRHLEDHLAARALWPLTPTVVADRLATALPPRSAGRLWRFHHRDSPQPE